MGHIFISPLTLGITHELGKKINSPVQRDEMCLYLVYFYEVEVMSDNKTRLPRGKMQRLLGKVLSAVGVAILPSVKTA